MKDLDKFLADRKEQLKHVNFREVPTNQRDWVELITGDPDYNPKERIVTTNTGRVIRTDDR